MGIYSLDGLISKIRLMLGRAVISAIRYDADIHRVQIHLLADELADDVEMMQQYGFVSAPLEGAEAVAGFIGGNRDLGIIIATHDRRYRLVLQGGEVAIHDDQGQKIHITRDGIVLDGGGKKITFRNTPEVFMDTPLLAVTGEIKDLSAGAGTFMSFIRSKFNLHKHKENNVLNNNTDGPDVSM